YVIEMPMRWRADRQAGAKSDRLQPALNRKGALGTRGSPAHNPFSTESLPAARTVRNARGNRRRRGGLMSREGAYAGETAEGPPGDRQGGGETMKRRGVRLGRILGVEIFLHPSWFLLAGLIAFVLGQGFSTGSPSFSGAGAALFGTLGAINLLLAAFNMLPGFPMDGGRVLRAAIWAGTHDLAKATRIAATAGRVIAIAMIGGGASLALLGVLPVNGIWLVLIGSFLYQSAHAAYRQAPAAGLAAHVGMTVGQVMTLRPE